MGLERAEPTAKDAPSGPAGPQWAALAARLAGQAGGQTFRLSFRLKPRPAPRTAIEAPAPAQVATSSPIDPPSPTYAGPRAALFAVATINADLAAAGKFGQPAPQPALGATPPPLPEVAPPAAVPGLIERLASTKAEPPPPLPVRPPPIPAVEPVPIYVEPPPPTAAWRLERLEAEVDLLIRSAGGEETPAVVAPSVPASPEAAPQDKGRLDLPFPVEPSTTVRLNPLPAEVSSNRPVDRDELPGLSPLVAEPGDNSFGSIEAQVTIVPRIIDRIPVIAPPKQRERRVRTVASGSPATYHGRTEEAAVEIVLTSAARNKPEAAAPEGADPAGASEAEPAQRFLRALAGDS